MSVGRARSFWDHGRYVDIDQWAANPLLDDYAQINPGFVDKLSARVTPPTLFETGDLPPFTASGVDPQVLARLPYRARHAAAAEPNAATLLGMVEEYGNDEMVEFPHIGLDSYRQRVKLWLMTPEPKPEVDSDANYESLFGADG